MSKTIDIMRERVKRFAEKTDFELSELQEKLSEALKQSSSNLTAAKLDVNGGESDDDDEDEHEEEEQEEEKRPSKKAKVKETRKTTKLIDPSEVESKLVVDTDGFVQVFTDGACEGNGKPGIVFRGKKKTAITLLHQCGAKFCLFLFFSPICFR